MKVAGRITAETLLVAKEMIHEGVTTKEIDDKINQYIKKCGFCPAFLDVLIYFVVDFFGSYTFVNPFLCNE